MFCGRVESSAPTPECTTTYEFAEILYRICSTLLHDLSDSAYRRATSPFRGGLGEPCCRGCVRFHCTTAACRPHGRICSFSFGDLSDSRRKSRPSADSTKNIQKNFRKIFNCGRRKSNGMRAVSVVLSAARCARFAASAGRKLKKSNRTGAQIRRKQNHSRKNGRYPEMLSASGLQNVKAVCALRRIWGGTCSPACFPRARTL